jgi:hypothetical protein
MKHGEEAVIMTVTAAPAATAPAVLTEAGLPPKEAVIPPQREGAALLQKEDGLLNHPAAGGLPLLPKEDVPPRHPAGGVRLNHPPAEDGHPVILPAAVGPVHPPGAIPAIPVNSVMLAVSLPAGPDGPVMAAVPVQVRAAAAAVVPAAADRFLTVLPHQEIKSCRALFPGFISGQSVRNLTKYFRSLSG